MMAQSRALVVLVHTVTLTHDDFVVSARFFHALSPAPDPRRVQLALLGRKVAVTVRRPRARRLAAEKHLVRHKARLPHFRHTLRAIHIGNQGRSTALTQAANITASPVATKEERDTQVLPALPIPVAIPGSPDSKQPATTPHSLPDESLQPLSNDATAQQTTQWLQRNRFDQYLRMFLSFSGADILRLSRDDLIQICGLADGIRLYNALHAKGIAPRLTVYLCVERDCVYHALYLASLSCVEMVSKLAHMLGVAPEQIRDLYMQGPGGIHVLITDEVVRNIKDEAMFAIEILQAAQSRECYRLLLKPVQH